MSINSEMTQATRKRQGTINAIRGYPSAIFETKPKFIDVRDSDQVMHWSRYFGATPLQLCNAIDKVGSDMTVVQRLLRTR